MKLGICTWDNLVAPVFDVSGTILLVQISPGQQEIRKQEVISVCDDLERIRRLSCLGIEVLICGAISRLWYDILTSWAIQVICYVAGDVDQVLQALKEKKLESQEFCIPGCPGLMQARNRETIENVVSAM